MTDMNLDVIKEHLERHHGGDITALVAEKMAKIDKENIDRAKLKASFKHALMYNRKLSHIERRLMQAMVHLL